MFPGLGSGLIGCGMIFMVRDPIMVWGMVPSQHFVNPITRLLALQVHAQGTSGSSWLSEESWPCSAGCGPSAPADSVVRFSSSHWFFLVEPSCFSATLFHLAYCLPPTLCSFLWNIARWTTLNDRLNFLVTFLMFLALLTM